MTTIRTHHVPPLDAIRALYAASPLRRPIDDPARLQMMFDHANVVHSAWEGDRLVGLLRGWTDGAFDGYVCDLAVHPDYQKAGVGKALMAPLFPEFPLVRWVLLASPLAEGYYGHVGWKPLENAWVQSHPDRPDTPTYEVFQAQFAELAAKA
ncbi:MAG TPA: GNAT family N-acetyltransferase [Holophagaceae bacterium]|nr:GNAT family N-acetyltransferase [Holophagaceae bacterium]